MMPPAEIAHVGLQTLRWHVSVGLHALPQLPQFLGSLFTSEHWLLHSD